eukprot:gene5159-34974_t
MFIPPVIEGPLPDSWGAFENLEYLNLSDAYGTGLIEGGIPHSWVGISTQMMESLSQHTDVWGWTALDYIHENIDATWYSGEAGSRTITPGGMQKIRVIDVRGHPNFCSDWHRKFMFDLLNHSITVEQGKLAAFEELIQDKWEQLWTYKDEFKIGTIPFQPPYAPLPPPPPSPPPPLLPPRPRTDTGAADCSFDISSIFVQTPEASPTGRFNVLIWTQDLDLIAWCSECGCSVQSDPGTVADHSTADTSIAPPVQLFESSQAGVDGPAVRSTSSYPQSADEVDIDYNAYDASDRKSDRLDSNAEAGLNSNQQAGGGNLTRGVAGLTGVGGGGMAAEGETGGRAAENQTAATVTFKTGNGETFPMALQKVEDRNGTEMPASFAAFVASSNPRTVSRADSPPPFRSSSTGTASANEDGGILVGTYNMSVQAPQWNGNFSFYLVFGEELVRRTVVVGYYAPGVDARLYMLPPITPFPWKVRPGSDLPLADELRPRIMLTLNFSESLTNFSMDKVKVEHADAIALRAMGSTGQLFQLLALAQPGQTATFRLPQSSYCSVHGLCGTKDVYLQVDVPPPPESIDNNTAAVVKDAGKPLSIAVVTTIATSTGLSLAAVAIGNMNAAAAALGKSSLMQSGYHIQMLAMSANIASPGIALVYRELASVFRWSLIEVKGNFESLDRVLNSGTEAHSESDLVGDAFKLRPGDHNTMVEVDSTEQSTLAESTPIDSNARNAPTTGPASLSKETVPTDSIATINSASEPPPSNHASLSISSAPPPSKPNAWRRSLKQEPQTGEASMGDEDDNSVTYLIDLNWNTEAQTLLYTLALSAVIISVVTVLHLLFNLVYRRYVSDPCPYTLWLPRFEVILGGFLLIAITFFASLALGSHDFDNGSPTFKTSDESVTAVLIILFLTLPFAVMLWWFTVLRVMRSRRSSREGGDKSADGHIVWDEVKVGYGLNEASSIRISMSTKNRHTDDDEKKTFGSGGRVSNGAGFRMSLIAPFRPSTPSTRASSMSNTPRASLTLGPRSPSPPLAGPRVSFLASRMVSATDLATGPNGRVGSSLRPDVLGGRLAARAGSMQRALSRQSSHLANRSEMPAGRVRSSNTVQVHTGGRVGSSIAAQSQTGGRAGSSNMVQDHPGSRAGSSSGVTSHQPSLDIHQNSSESGWKKRTQFLSQSAVRHSSAATRLPLPSMTPNPEFQHPAAVLSYLPSDAAQLPLPPMPPTVEYHHPATTQLPLPSMTPTPKFQHPATVLSYLPSGSSVNTRAGRQGRPMSSPGLRDNHVQHGSSGQHDSWGHTALPGPFQQPFYQSDERSSLPSISSAPDRGSPAGSQKRAGARSLPRADIPEFLAECKPSPSFLPHSRGNSDKGGDIPVEVETLPEKATWATRVEVFKKEPTLTPIVTPPRPSPKKKPEPVKPPPPHGGKPFAAYLEPPPRPPPSTGGRSQTRVQAITVKPGAQPASVFKRLSMYRQYFEKKPHDKTNQLKEPEALMADQASAEQADAKGLVQKRTQEHDSAEGVRTRKLAFGASFDLLPPPASASETEVQPFEKAEQNEGQWAERREVEGAWGVLSPPPPSRNEEPDEVTETGAFSGAWVPGQGEGCQRQVMQIKVLAKEDLVSLGGGQKGTFLSRPFPNPREDNLIRLGGGQAILSRPSPNPREDDLVSLGGGQEGKILTRPSRIRREWMDPVNEDDQVNTDDLVSLGGGQPIEKAELNEGQWAERREVGGAWGVLSPPLPSRNEEPDEVTETGVFNGGWVPGQGDGSQHQVMQIKVLAKEDLVSLGGGQKGTFLSRPSPIQREGTDRVYEDVRVSPGRVYEDDLVSLDGGQGGRILSRRSPIQREGMDLVYEDAQVNKDDLVSLGGGQGGKILSRRSPIQREAMGPVYEDAQVNKDDLVSLVGGQGGRILSRRSPLQREGMDPVYEDGRVYEDDLVSLGGGQAGRAFSNRPCQHQEMGDEGPEDDLASLGGGQAGGVLAMRPRRHKEMGDDNEMPEIDVPSLGRGTAKGVLSQADHISEDDMCSLNGENSVGGEKQRGPAEVQEVQGVRRPRSKRASQLNRRVTNTWEGVRRTGASFATFMRTGSIFVVPPNAAGGLLSRSASVSSNGIPTATTECPSRFVTIEPSEFERDSLDSTTSSALSQQDCMEDDKVQHAAITQELAAPTFVNRFDFLFEDVLGDDTEKWMGREQWWRLIAAALNFTHKAACAVLFGYFGLQFLMIMYLLVARPYIRWQLQWLEVVGHVLVAVIMICAMSIEDESVNWAACWIMVGSLIALVLAIIAYEIWYLVQAGRVLWPKFKAWWEERRQLKTGKNSQEDSGSDGVPKLDDMDVSKGGYQVVHRGGSTRASSANRLGPASSPASTGLQKPGGDVYTTEETKN